MACGLAFGCFEGSVVMVACGGVDGVVVDIFWFHLIDHVAFAGWEKWCDHLVLDSRINTRMTKGRMLHFSQE